jgi:hypothetical protein
MPLLVESITTLLGVLLGLLAGRFAIEGILAATFGSPEPEVTPVPRPERPG